MAQDALHGPYAAAGSPQPLSEANFERHAEPDDRKVTVMRKHRAGALLAMAGLLLTGAAGQLPTRTAAMAEQRATGVCDGVRRCHQVATVDVDGDGTADPVGIARRGKDGAEHGKVIVRVKVGDIIVSTRRKTSYWYGSPWQGAGRLDGEAGKDLMVGSTSGAHTLFFHGLTWRDGSLVTLDAPGRGHAWVIDGAYSIAIGWLRKGSWPAGKIYKRTAVRQESGKFKGTVTSFRWTKGAWEPTSGSSAYPMSDKQAYSWSGFHVPGLKRYE